MNKVERLFAKLTFTGQKKIRIIRQIQRLLGSGIPVQRTLEILWDRYSKKGKKPKDPLAQMLQEWQGQLRMGKSLAASMHGWISLSEEMIIQAGEQSDRLSTSFDDALQASNAGRGIRNAIIGGLIYPIALLAALIFTMYGFQFKIAPAFTSILPIEKWSGNALVIYNISHAIVTWMPLIGMVLGGFITAATLSMPILTGPLRRILDYVPPWSIYKITQGASFMISLRGFISAGTRVPDALRNMLKIGNPYFKERVGSFLSRMNMGRNVGEAMIEAGYNFPDEDIAGELSIYADLDNFDTSLDVLAKEWINGSVDRAKSAAKIINNIMLFLVAGTIGYIFAAMFELQNLISNSLQ